MSDKDVRAAGDQTLLARALESIPGGTLGNITGSPERSIVITRGSGSHLYDAGGNEYVDYLLGSGPMILGHAHPSIVAAVVEAVEKGSTFFAINDTVIQLAEELVRAIPCADQVRFTTSGTDACFQCLRLARAFRRRDKILKFEGGYHGTSDYALMSVSPGPQAPDYPTPLPGSAGIPNVVQETVLIAPFNDLETTSALIERHHDELAAVIVEPFQRIIPPKPGFLQGLRQVTSLYEIPLIFDEVVTGFRFSYGGAQEYYGVVPDLAAYGKIVGGGYPLGAVAGRTYLMQAYDPTLQGTSEYVPQIGTLSGNPVSAAAGLATLHELQKPGTYEHLHAMGTQLQEGLAAALSQAEIAGRVVGVGPLFEVYFTEEEIWNYRDTAKTNSKLQREMYALLLERGIFKSPEKYYLSLAHTPQDFQRTVDAFSDALQHLHG